MKVSYTIRIIAGLVLAAVLTALLVVGMQGSLPKLGGFQLGGLQYDHAEEYTAGPGQWPGDTIRRLDVNWIQGRVELEVGADDTLSIAEAEGGSRESKNQLHWWLDGDTLRIQPGRATRFSLDNQGKKTLIVTLPLGWQGEELEVESVSAEVVGRGLAVPEIQVESVSGDITLTEVVTQRLSLDTVSGKGEITGEIDALETDSVSGKMIITCPVRQPSQVQTDSVSGDVTLILPADSAFTARLESVSGEIREDFGGNEGEQVAWGAGGPRYRFDSVSGDVFIQPLED